MFFSIIIPLYNRPQEIKELLDSLCEQTYSNFEVIVVEDGSSIAADTIVDAFQHRLDLSYYFIDNGGQGFARNYGFSKANGEYFIIFDSDCIIPADYLQQVNSLLANNDLDVYGGPDAAHPDFTKNQKAISFAMTSMLTTGGIRGGAKHIGQFHPRSFNMGISRKVWEETGGFRWTNRSEDLELSIRLHRKGFAIGLLREARVFHKRRGDFLSFFKQIYGFGRGRIRIFRHFSSELKLVHLFPLFFSVGALVLLCLNVFTDLSFLKPLNILFAGYIAALFFTAFVTSKSLIVAILSVFASIVQFFAYGMGVVAEFLRATSDT